MMTSRMQVVLRPLRSFESGALYVCFGALRRCNASVDCTTTYFQYDTNGRELLRSPWILSDNDTSIFLR